MENNGNKIFNERIRLVIYIVISVLMVVGIISGIYMTVNSQIDSTEDRVLEIEIEHRDLKEKLDKIENSIEHIQNNDLRHVTNALIMICGSLGLDCKDPHWFD